MPNPILALAAYLFLAMTSWVPLGSHAWEERISVTEQRYHAIAEDIAIVSVGEPPLFDGADGQVQTGLLLASIGAHESAFRAPVDACEVSGDVGTAWGLWQVHAPKAEVCSSRRAAIRAAVAKIRESFRKCDRANLLDMLAVYASGPKGIGPDRRCISPHRESRDMMSEAIRWQILHPFTPPNASAGPP